MEYLMGYILEQLDILVLNTELLPRSESIRGPLMTLVRITKEFYEELGVQKGDYVEQILDTACYLPRSEERERIIAAAEALQHRFKFEVVTGDSPNKDNLQRLAASGVV